MNYFLAYRPKFTSPNIGGYRYFFNGQEGDNEVFGENSLFAFEYRMHDARLGRFWSIDPLAAKYPWWSTYQFAGLMPTWYREMEGLEPDYNGSYNGQGAYAPILDENNKPLPNTENQTWIWNNSIWNKADVAVVYETMESVFTRANPTYLKNVEIAINLHGSSFGLNSYESICHFLSQTGHESAGFTTVEEKFNYSVNGLVSTFSKYFYVGTPVEGKYDATKYARTEDHPAKAEEIANIVYSNRMGNGANEGYLYRGRGLIQLTGKSAYQSFTDYINATFTNNTVDFVKDPDLIKTDQYMVLSAMWFFKKNVVDKIDVKDASVKEVTKIINGGYNRLKDRESKYIQLKSVLK
jgi:putative chitinase